MRAKRRESDKKLGLLMEKEPCVCSSAVARNHSTCDIHPSVRLSFFSSSPIPRSWRWSTLSIRHDLSPALTGERARRMERAELSPFAVISRRLEKVREQAGWIESREPVPFPFRFFTPD